MRLRVKVIPNAARDEVCGWMGEALKVKVKAVPEGGRANKALTAFLAKTFGLPKRAVSVVSGETAREKLVEADGLDEAALQALFPRD